MGGFAGRQDPGRQGHDAGLHRLDDQFRRAPAAVAQRICNVANIVGRERVIAGADCGFATFAGQQNPVVPSVVWAKLAALAEGARIATAKLWGRA